MVSLAPEAALIALLLLPAALANGQTSHLWISERAFELLPEGELRDALAREDVHVALRNGTMFPDGGYPLGDDYAEIAHWEPFQGLYLDWIRAHYSPPWSDEALVHIGFLMGLGSHGLADQTYDALYMERAKQEDAASDWATYSMDEATDVALATQEGAQEVSEDVVPYDLLVELYADYGYTVERATLEEGQSLLRLAVGLVGQMGENGTAIALYEERFPWATTHQFDPDQPGTPEDEAHIVAAYWAVIWGRLHGEDWREEPLLGTFPLDGAYAQPRDASRVESRVALVYSRGVEEASLSVGDLQVTDGAGPAHPFDIDLFYGQSAHIVLVKPTEDWAEDQTYAVTAAPTVTFLDGTTLQEEVGFGFSTGEAPPEVEADPTEPGCGCAASRTSPAWAGLLAGLALLRRRRS